MSVELLGLGQKATDRSREGFTLIEVLVALAVASLLCVAYIGVMRQSAQFAGDAQDAMRNVAIAQEYFIQNTFTARRLPTPDWITWQGESLGEWRLATEDAGGHAKMILETRVAGVAMQWPWFMP